MPVFKDGRLDTGGSGGSGSSDWIGLTDTPGAITGDGVVVGNSGGTALEFIPISSLIEGIKYSWLDATERTAQTGMVTDELGVQRDSGDVYKWNGAAWVVFFNLQDGAAAASNPSYEAVASDTRDMAPIVYSDIDSMTVTPGAGTYLAWFTVDVFRLVGPSDSDVFFRFAVNGTGQAESARSKRITGIPDTVQIIDRLVVGAGESVTVQALTTGTTQPTARITTRSLILMKTG